MIDAVVREVTIQTPGRGLLEVTSEIAANVRSAGLSAGLCTIFIRHTSASLTIQENADPVGEGTISSGGWTGSCRRRPALHPHRRGPRRHAVAHQGGPHRHFAVDSGHRTAVLALGTWQGIYLWEHRRAPHRRSIVVHVG